MLAMVAGLGALYALVLAAAPARDFFELELLSSGQLFLCLLSVAAGLVAASALWRLPQIQELEVPETREPPQPEREPRVPAPTHRPATGEHGLGGEKPA
jgi:hypothetical protein